jgi:hypothetical protein
MDPELKLDDVDIIAFERRVDDAGYFGTGLEYVHDLDFFFDLGQRVVRWPTEHSVSIWIDRNDFVALLLEVFRDSMRSFASRNSLRLRPCLSRGFLGLRRLFLLACCLPGLCRAKRFNRTICLLAAKTLIGSAEGFPETNLTPLLKPII